MMRSYRDRLVSIVIVNYNSGTYLPRCLDSLRAQTLKDLEIIIVDNASMDGSLDHLSTYPDVGLVRNPTNRGFAAAMNQGISVAQGRYILALNFDVVLTPTFLEQIVRGIGNRPEVGWACGKLLLMTPDGTFSDRIYATGHVLPVNRFPLLRGFGEQDNSQYDMPEYVFGAPGAAALYRREMLQDILFDGQFFDERFFTWCEDVDVDWRAQNRGWKCIYVPTAVAYHTGHVDEQYREPFRSFRAMLTIRNRWLMMLANDRPRHLLSTAVLRYEASLLVYVLRARLTISYLKAVASFICLLPAALRKRQQLAAGVR